MEKSRKHIDEMTKTELKVELDDLRNEYDMMALRAEIVKMIDRMVTVSDLKKIRDFVEKVYKKEVAGTWGFWYGMRDNIVDMANNLADEQNIQELQYLNHFMFATVLQNAPDAAKGLHTVTSDMEHSLLKHLREVKAV